MFQDMLDFLQSRNALAGRKLRELKLKGEPIPDAVPEYLRCKLTGLMAVPMECIDSRVMLFLTKCL